LAIHPGPQAVLRTSTLKQGWQTMETEDHTAQILGFTGLLEAPEGDGSGEFEIRRYIAPAWPSSA
jgi:hypothetical protein